MTRFDLFNYRIRKLLLNMQRNEVKSRIDKLTEISSTNYSEKTSRSKIVYDTMAENLAILIDMNTNLDKQYAEQEHELIVIENVVKSLSDPRHVYILTKYYLSEVKEMQKINQKTQGKITVSEIAEDLGLTDRQIIRIKDDALDEFDAKCKELEVNQEAL